MQQLEFSSAMPRAELRFPGGTAELCAEGGALCLRLPYHAAYGMGEKYNGLNQKGNTVVNEVREQFCFQGEQTYCSAPFFWTDTGFGLFADTCLSTQFTFEEGEIRAQLPPCRVWLFAGAPAQLLREYMSLFGPAALPPRWAFGVWISANRWHTQAEAEAQLALLRRWNFPASVLVLEAWSDEATFYLWNGARCRAVPEGKPVRAEDVLDAGAVWPDPAGMIRRLHAAGLHLILWQVPVYKKQEPSEPLSLQNELDRADAVRRGLCVHRTNGAPYTIAKGRWFAGSMIPDFTNPAAVESWFGKRRYLLEMGVDGFKTDGGEFVSEEDARFFDGSTGAEGQNRYPRDYTEAYRDFLGPERVLFSRAGFAGQHTVPLHWAGDQQSRNSELRAALSAGLSAALTGIPFWGFDIGGFAGPLPTEDLYRRATQLACFCPVMQWHSEPDGGQFRALLPGAEGNNERSPWNMARACAHPEFLTELRFWHWLRENLMPYLWHTARRCAAESRPMMRPLVYDWPDDAAARACEDEYLFGESLLVAPLLEENAVSRTVYLPKGRWLGLFDRQRQSGGAVRAGGAGRMPVFLREGKALALNLGRTLALGEPVRRDVPYDHLHFLLAGQSGETAFEDGAGSRFTLRWAQGKAELCGDAAVSVTWEIL